MSNSSEHHTPSDPGQEGNPVKEMFLLAALYLPMGFFLWFFAASLLMLPARLMLEAVLINGFPGVFERVFQADFMFEIQTLIAVPNREGEGELLLTWDVNPMIYAWGMALLFGLIMATPLSVKRRLVQMMLGFVVVSGVVIWGTFWEVWRDLAFLWSSHYASVAQVAADSGLSRTWIALCAQLGYLMFPAVVPLATWILMNRTFIENDVVGWTQLNRD